VYIAAVQLMRLLFCVLICLPLHAVDEQALTVTKVSAVSKRLVLIEADVTGKHTELECFSSIPSCSEPELGEYTMAPAGEGDGIYTDCWNVVLYRKSSGEAKQKVGVYCWLGGPDCLLCGSVLQAEVDPAKISDEGSLRNESARKKHPKDFQANDRIDRPVPNIFLSALAEVKAKTSIPLLLPTELPRPFRDAKDATVEKIAPDEYAVALWYELGAGDAGYAASFSGKNNPRYSPRELGNISEVKLTRGIVGFFRPVSCGGSCAPANLWWQQGASLYNIQLKLGSTLGEKKQQKIITEVANSAIQAGPR